MANGEITEVSFAHITLPAEATIAIVMLQNSPRSVHSTNSFCCPMSTTIDGDTCTTIPDDPTRASKLEIDCQSRTACGDGVSEVCAEHRSKSSESEGKVEKHSSGARLIWGVATGWLTALVVRIGQDLGVLIAYMPSLMNLLRLAMRNLDPQRRTPWPKWMDVCQSLRFGSGHHQVTTRQKDSASTEAI